MNPRMAMAALLSAVVLLNVPHAAAAQDPLGFPTDPRDAELVTGDIERFRHLMAALPGAPDTVAAVQRLYLDPASPGLRLYVDNFGLEAGDFARAIARRPDFFRSLTDLDDRIAEGAPEIRAALQGMESIHPESVFPPVYFFIGAFRAGGLARDVGLLIAAEMYAKGPGTDMGEFTEPTALHEFAKLPHLVTHELAHFQQFTLQGLDRYRELYRSGTTLLGLAIREGSADYLARLASGGHINDEAHAYGLAHEGELWKQFRREMHGAETGDWMFADPDDAAWPQDLGYFMGYRITEALHSRADDPAAAIQSILAASDFHGFLIRSGYDGGGVPVPATEEYTITTLAGTGEAGYSGDGGPAAEAELDHPSAVAVESDGTVYIADSRNHRIRRVDASGRITTVAGTGEPGYGGDGGPAVDALLRHPYGVAVGPEGRVYIADQANQRVRRIERDGTIMTVAGTGREGGGGDGGPATEAELDFPNIVAWDDRGRMYIGEGGGDRVRRVDRDGTIHTVAGTHLGRRYNGNGMLAGDGGPATSAHLYVVGDVAVAADGSIVIADLGNAVVRKVDPRGVITTVAGTGREGYNGDQPDATAAHLSDPGGVAVLPDGGIVFADGGNRMVRVLTPDGAVRTIAGTGEDGYSGDGGPARLAELSILDILTVDDRGRIYISDYGNNAVRVLTPGAPPLDPTSDVEALLLAVREAYASARDIELAFEVRRPGRATRSGRIRWSGDGALDARLDIPDYGVVRLTSDGYRLVVDDPTRPEPIHFDHSREQLQDHLYGNLPVYGLFDGRRQFSTGKDGNMRGSTLSVRHPVRWRDREWIVLTESAGSVRYDYYIDPDSFLLHRAARYSGDDPEPTYDSVVTGIRRSGGASPTSR